MMKKYFILLIFIGYIVSCVSKNDKQDNVALIQIKIDKPDVSSLQPLLLSEFADSVEYLQLETTEDCLLRYERPFRVGRFLLFSGLYSILQFDAVTGKFLRPIGRQGQGPKEYVQIRRVCVNKDDNQIIVQNTGNKLMIFDYEGNYHDNIHLADTTDKLFTDCFYSLYLNYIDRQYMIFTSEMMPAKHACQPHEIIVYDYVNKTIQHTLPNYLDCPYERYSVSMNGMRAGTRYNEDMFFKLFYNDTLYVINTEKGVSPYAVIDLGKYKLPNELFWSRTGMSDIAGKIAIDAIYVDSNCILFQCYIATTDLKNIKSFICKYDKNNGKLTYHSNGLINDLDGGQIVDARNLQEGIIAVVHPEIVKDEDKKHIFSELPESELKYPALKDKFDQMQAKRDPDDNPLLMILHKKK